MKKREFYFIGALFLAVFFYFFNIILKKNFLWEDFLEFFYPLRNYLAVSLKAHKIPYWCPYIFSGMPFLSEPQTAVFYPFNVLNVLFVRKGVLSYYALEIELILHYLMAILFMYFLLRRWRFSPLSSVTGSIIYTFSAFMVLHSIHGNLIHTAAYYPLLLYLLDRFLNPPNLLFGLLYLFFLYLATLAGYPQLITYWFLFSGLYFLYSIADKKFIFKRSLYFALIFFVFVLLWMWQLKATTFMTNFTERRVLSFEASAENSIPPLVLLQRLLLPEFFGRVDGLMNSTNYYFGGPYWNFWESGIYVGVVSLFLLSVSFMRRRDKRVLFFLVVFFLSLLLVLGKYGFLYNLLYYILPPLRRFRNPPRFSIFLALSTGILAAYGLSYFENYRFRRKKDKNRLSLISRYILVFSIATLVLLVLLFIFLPKTTSLELLKRKYMLRSSLILSLFSFLSFGVVCIFRKTLDRKILSLFPIIVFLDLYIFGHSFPLGDIRGEDYYSKRRIPSYIVNDRDIFRLNIRDGRNLYVPRNSGAVMGLEIIDGYEVLRFKRYLDFYDNVERKAKLDLLNVKYYLKVEGKRASLVPNPDFMPRAFFVNDYKILNRDSIIALLKGGWKGYRDTVLLEESFPIPHEEIGNGVVESIERMRDGLKVKVNCYGRSILVLSEVFYPEREVLVDSKPVEKYIAYTILTAVPIEPGRHTVELVYNPRSFKSGLKLTFLGVIFYLVLLPVALFEWKKIKWSRGDSNP